MNSEVSVANEIPELISWGDSPKILRNLFSLTNLVQLLEAKLLIPYGLTSGIGLQNQSSFTLKRLGIPLVQFRLFLERQPHIKFEDHQNTVRFLESVTDRNYTIGVTEEHWMKDPWSKRSGTPNIIFFCDVGGNPSDRSARATYKDLYQLLKFLKRQLSH